MLTVRRLAERYSMAPPYTPEAFFTVLPLAAFLITLFPASLSPCFVPFATANSGPLIGLALIPPWCSVLSRYQHHCLGTPDMTSLSPSNSPSTLIARSAKYPVHHYPSFTFWIILLSSVPRRRPSVCQSDRCPCVITKLRTQTSTAILTSHALTSFLSPGAGAP